MTGERHLSTEPARKLTSRECARILCGCVGALCESADPEDLRTAVLWTAEHFDDLVGQIMSGAATALAAEAARRPKKPES
jgi:hypothetical protein